MEPFQAFFGTKCTPYLEARIKARSGVKGLRIKKFNVSFTVEFIEVGKKEPALDALYDVIKSKKHRTWQNKIHEPILFKYLELCVDLRRSHIAKEGLYQYKLICQQVNIVSLEDVIRYFLKLAEDRAETARKESRDQVPIVEDLDQIQTPERYSLFAVFAINKIRFEVLISKSNVVPVI